MNLVKNGRPIFINCNNCGNRYLPDVAINNNSPKTKIDNIRKLNLFLLIFLILLDLVLRITKITMTIIKIIRNLIISKFK